MQPLFRIKYILLNSRIQINLHPYPHWTFTCWPKHLNILQSNSKDLLKWPNSNYFHFSSSCLSGPNIFWILKLFLIGFYRSFFPHCLSSNLKFQVYCLCHWLPINKETKPGQLECEYQLRYQGKTSLWVVACFLQVAFPIHSHSRPWDTPSEGETGGCLLNELAVNQFIRT